MGDESKSIEASRSTPPSPRAIVAPPRMVLESPTTEALLRLFGEVKAYVEIVERRHAAGEERVEHAIRRQRELERLVNEAKEEAARARSEASEARLAATRPVRSASLSELAATAGHVEGELPLTTSMRIVAENMRRQAETLQKQPTRRDDAIGKALQLLVLLLFYWLTTKGH